VGWRLMSGTHRLSLTGPRIYNVRRFHTGMSNQVAPRTHRLSLTGPGIYDICRFYTGMRIRLPHANLLTCPHYIGTFIATPPR
jgi:hypothetical protein